VGRNAAEFKEKAKKLLKELFTTPLGIVSWILANIFWTSFWAIPLAIGYITKNEEFYVLSGSIFFFFWQPLVPMWLITPVSSIFISRLLRKNFIKQ
jgi:hypothetical protein